MQEHVRLDALPDVPDGLDPVDVLISLAVIALRPTAGEVELLAGRPHRDDLQFGRRERPGTDTLAAWLYAPSPRIAYAVHAPAWDPPGGSARENWVALLADHLHATERWTDVNVVAMPVRVPFDEPGLRIVPLLAVWADVSPDGVSWLGGTMATSVKDGAPHVVPVHTFSGARFVAHLGGDGVTEVDVARRADLATLGW